VPDSKQETASTTTATALSKEQGQASAESTTSPPSLVEDSKPAAIATLSATNTDTTDAATTQGHEPAHSDTSRINDSLLENELIAMHHSETLDSMPFPWDVENTLEVTWDDHEWMTVDHNRGPVTSTDSTLSDDTAENPAQADPSVEAISTSPTEQGTYTRLGTSPRSVFYPLPTFRKVAKATTIPFDDRPLAPLAQAIDNLCTQLKNSTLGTVQLEQCLQKGKKLLQAVEEKRHCTTIDWHERVLHKTLKEKLACHVRLYQCLAGWTQALTEEEQYTFEALIVPTLKQEFLTAGTNVQQDLLTYWEQGSPCNADLLC